jgi:hypothetical protein
MVKPDQAFLYKVGMLIAPGGVFARNITDSAKIAKDELRKSLLVTAVGKFGKNIIGKCAVRVLCVAHFSTP